MANRKTTLDKKVAALRECLTMRDVKAVMEKHGFSERSGWYWFARIIEHLPEILTSKRPGPKRKRLKKSPFLRGD